MTELEEEATEVAKFVESKLGSPIERSLGLIVNIEDVDGKNIEAVFLGIIMDEHDSVVVLARRQNIKFAQAWHYSRLLGRARS